jgi:spoIIIJ-associated protein
MKVITATGKNIDDAIDNTLKIYNLKRSDVDILIMDEGKRGFLGIGSKDAIVKIKVKTQKIKDILKSYIEDILANLDFDAEVNVSLKKRSKVFKVDIEGHNLAVLIGKHGQTLASIEHIANLFLNKFVTTKVKVVVDVDSYMQKRRDTVERIAKSAIAKVLHDKSYFQLDPMSSFERRIVHSMVQKYKNLDSYSVGIEPFRTVIIEHKKFEKDHDVAKLQTRGGVWNTKTL